VPGLRDSIQDERTGWLVEDSRDPALLVSRLSAGLLRALEELEVPARRAELGAACRAWAETFTWTDMRQRMQQIVATELDQRSG
jgi:glycosyltransferase involved in cell wall biosynthesis